MEKRNFVKLIKLVDIAYEGETEAQRERWLRNVINSVGEDAYSLDVDDDYKTKQFTTDEIEFVTVDCYNFMGSAYEDERFYAADWITVVERATGDVYAYETEEIFEGAF
jgi:hypothetical protein